jgi:hypothetical protein
MQIESAEQVMVTMEDLDEQREEARRDGNNWYGEDYDYRDWWVHTGDTYKNGDNETVYKFYKKHWQDGSVNKDVYYVTTNLSNMTVGKSFEYGFAIDSQGDEEYYDEGIRSIKEVKTVSSTDAFTNNTIQFSLRTSLYTDPISYEVEFTKTSDNMFSVIKKSQSTTQYNSIVK